MSVTRPHWRFGAAVRHLPFERLGVRERSHEDFRAPGLVGLIRYPLAIGRDRDGLLVEVHHDPDKALSDGIQSILPEAFTALTEEVRQIAAVLHREIN